MKRAMAGQPSRSGSAGRKSLNAEGEFQAAEKLVQAASMISAQPIALQLRSLQTMKGLSSEHNTTTILPIPVDLFASFIKVPKAHVRRNRTRHIESDLEQQSSEVSHRGKPRRLSILKILFCELTP
jgi:hypothetical protein